MSDPFSLGKADSIGARANELLSRPSFYGHVFALVSSAVYLTSSDEEIFWLGKSGLPRHPRAVLGSFDLDSFRVGMSFYRNGRHLQFDNNFSLDWTDALPWRPASLSSDRLAPRDLVSVRLGQLMDLLRAGDTVADSRPNPFDNAAIDSKAEIARACRDRDWTRVLEVGRKLIGLGSGLTPAGDDFLGGLLFVAYHLNVLYPGVFHWERESMLNWLRPARAQTNLISYAILCDHVSGQGVEPLYNLLGAMLKDGEPGEMIRYADNLCTIGSTSGTEMLAGAITGMFLIAETT